jgi:hypothetical protein
MALLLLLLLLLSLLVMLPRFQLCVRGFTDRALSRKRKDYVPRAMVPRGIPIHRQDEGLGEQGGNKSDAPCTLATTFSRRLSRFSDEERRETMRRRIIPNETRIDESSFPFPRARARALLRSTQHRERTREATRSNSGDERDLSYPVARITTARPHRRYQPVGRGGTRGRQGKEKEPTTTRRAEQWSKPARVRNGHRVERQLRTDCRLLSRSEPASSLPWLEL